VQASTVVAPPQFGHFDLIYMSKAFSDASTSGWAKGNPIHARPWQLRGSGVGEADHVMNDLGDAGAADRSDSVCSSSADSEEYFGP